MKLTKGTEVRVVLPDTCMFVDHKDKDGWLWIVDEDGKPVIVVKDLKDLEDLGAQTFIVV